jgi:hypothetical protein
MLMTFPVPFPTKSLLEESVDDPVPPYCAVMGVAFHVPVVTVPRVVIDAEPARGEYVASRKVFIDPVALLNVICLVCPALVSTIGKRSLESAEASEVRLEMVLFAPTTGSTGAPVKSAEIESQRPRKNSFMLVSRR